VLGIIIFRNSLLNLYGSFYLQGAAVLVMVSIGQVVNASVGSVWYIVSMTGYPRLTLIGKSIALTVNIILNSILIPIYGINGAAFATMMSTSINNIIGFFFVRKILRTSINSLNK
jgi:O-antigen/teichoic acid export membrane protein